MSGQGRRATRPPTRQSRRPVRRRGAPELREARTALRSFRRYLTTTAFLRTGPRARVLPDGTAVAPDDAPEVVRRVILAANQIAKFPLQVGWRSRRLARQRLRLLGLGLLRARGRGAAAGRWPRAASSTTARRDRVNGSRSTRTRATSSWSWRASASTRAGAAASARAGGSRLDRRAVSWRATCRACSASTGRRGARVVSLPPAMPSKLFAAGLLDGQVAIVSGEAPASARRPPSSWPPAAHRSWCAAGDPSRLRRPPR